MVTTRTLASGYLSPKKARAPDASASSMFMMSVRISRFLRISSFTCCSISPSSLGSTCAKCEKSKSQVIGRDQRAGLLHVRAQNIAQSGVQQVRCRVVAHVAHASFGIGDGGDVIADVQVFLRDDAMRDQPGDRVVGAAHFGEFEAIPELS